MFKRRRKFRGTWLPVIGQFDDADLTRTISGFRFTLRHDGVEPPTLIFPITYDAPQDIDTANNLTEGLGELIGNEYALRRIVGKCHIQRITAGDPVTDYVGGVIVGLGFFIARAQDSNNDPNLPVGAPAAAGETDLGRHELYSPLSAATAREPWIWRRTWNLGGGYGLGPDNEGAVFSNGSNTIAASSLDGPHIDAKTRRRIRQEERLYAAVSMTPMAGTSLASWVAKNQQIAGYLDVRLFGQLRRPRNQGQF